jgi:N6-L-threonylcarbamoyladenine synthase
MLNLKHQLDAKNEEIRIADICASFQKAAIDQIVSKVLLAVEKFSFNQVVIGGGVAANSYLRETLSQKLLPYQLQPIFAPLELTGDNGAMIATLGEILYNNGKRSDLNIAADPNWSINDLRKE